MKRILIAASALAMALTGSVASAQSWERRDDRGYHQDHRYDNRHDRRVERRDDRRWDDRRYDRREYRYSRGERYRGDGRRFDDYHRYGYRAPPRGYSYYRTSNGDVVLAAIATGIIASVIFSQ